MAITHKLKDVPTIGELVKDASVSIYIHKRGEYTNYSFDYNIEFNSGKIIIISGDYGDSFGPDFKKYEKLFENFEKYKISNLSYKVPIDVFEAEYEKCVDAEK